MRLSPIKQIKQTWRIFLLLTLFFTETKNIIRMSFHIFRTPSLEPYIFKETSSLYSNNTRRREFSLNGFQCFRLMDFVDNNANQKDLTIEIGNNISIGLISGYGIYRESQRQRQIGAIITRSYLLPMFTFSPLSIIRKYFWGYIVCIELLLSHKSSNR